MPRPDIEAIKARLEAATPGPWAWDDDGGYLRGPDDSEIICTDSCIYPPLGNPGLGSEREEHLRKHPEDDIVGRYAKECLAEWHEEPKDADLIAHAPTDIRELLDYVADLEALVKPTSDEEFDQMCKNVRDAQKRAAEVCHTPRRVVREGGRTYEVVIGSDEDPHA